MNKINVFRNISSIGTDDSNWAVIFDDEFLKKTDVTSNKTDSLLLKILVGGLDYCKYTVKWNVTEMSENSGIGIVEIKKCVKELKELEIMKYNKTNKGYLINSEMYSVGKIQ